MKFTLDYIPKVTWEPDTDKWRLFPVDEFEQDTAGLDIVMKWVIDDDIIYMVDYEADSIIDGFNKGYLDKVMVSGVNAYGRRERVYLDKYPKRKKSRNRWFHTKVK